MSELREITDALRSALGRDEPAVLATIVKTEGSTYRKPGARMLFTPGGGAVGFLSGGCLEADLAERAEQVLRSGETRTVLYDMRSPDDIVWGLGLGCGGAVRVLLERLPAGDVPRYLRFLEASLESRRAGVVVSVFDVEGKIPLRVGDRLIFDENGRSEDEPADRLLRPAIEGAAREVLSGGRSVVRAFDGEGGSAEALVEHVAPPTALLVAGAGRDAVPLVRFAAALGWRVTVADHRSAYADIRRFPDAHAVRVVDYANLADAGLEIDGATAVIVMTHHFLHDLELMRFLLPSAAPYVGFLGPRLRTENLIRELTEGGGAPTREQLVRLHGPVGVDIGSETPEEIALSALAEIRAVLAGRAGGFLRDGTRPLHDP